jgi:hypothetical protein
MDTKSDAKCECGNSASVVAAFRAAPRILCGACYEKKSMKFSVSEEFLIDALTVIARTTGLKSATLDALREMTSNAPAQ